MSLAQVLHGEKRGRHWNSPGTSLKAENEDWHSATGARVVQAFNHLRAEVVVLAVVGFEFNSGRFYRNRVCEQF